MKRFASMSFSVLITACTATEADTSTLCAAAADHVASCALGASSVSAECDAESAMEVLSLDCAELATTADAAKADGSCPSFLEWVGLCGPERDPDPDPCGHPDLTCLDCQALEYCGWCGTDGRCAEGDINGPLRGTCGDWRWDRVECFDPPLPEEPPDATDAECADALDCTECASRAGCGWCANLGRCTNGTLDGSLLCGDEDWVWVSSLCSE